MTFATVADVEANWRPVTSEQRPLVQTKLDYAELLIRKAAAGVDAWVAAGRLDAGIVRFVAVEMVRNFLINPEGWRQQSIDDWTGVRDSTLAAGQLYLTDEMRQLLTPNDSNPTGAFTITPGPAPRSAPWAEC